MGRGCCGLGRRAYHGLSLTVPHRPAPPAPSACISIMYTDDCVTTNLGALGTVLDCSVCLYWDSSRNCPKSANSDSISHICAGDQFYGVIPSPGALPIVGATNKRNTWWGGSDRKWRERAGAGRGRGAGGWTVQSIPRPPGGHYNGALWLLLSPAPCLLAMQSATARWSALTRAPPTPPLTSP